MFQNLIGKYTEVYLYINATYHNQIDVNLRFK